MNDRGTPPRARPRPGGSRDLHGIHDVRFGDHDKLGIRPLSSFHVASSRLPLPPRARWTSSVSASKPAASRTHCARGFRIVSTAVISASGRSPRPASPNAPCARADVLPGRGLERLVHPDRRSPAGGILDDRGRPHPFAPRLVRNVGRRRRRCRSAAPRRPCLSGSSLPVAFLISSLSFAADHPVDRFDEGRTELHRRIRPGAGGWLDVGQGERALPHAVSDLVRGPAAGLECRPDRVVEGARLQVRVRGREPLSNGGPDGGYRWAIDQG